MENDNELNSSTWVTFPIFVIKDSSHCQQKSGLQRDFFKDE